MQTANDAEYKKLRKLVGNYQALYVGFEPDKHDLQLLYTVDSLVLRGIPANDPAFFSLVARQMSREIEMGLRAMHFGEVKNLDTNIRSREYLRDATKFERNP